MAHRLEDLYPGRSVPADASYPGGSIQNETTPTVPATPITPGSNDGTPLDNVWANDKEGFFQGILDEAGIIADNTTDTVTTSQYRNALKVVTGGAGSYQNDIDYVLNNYALGGDGAIYRTLLANGPGTSVVDPVGDLTGTWIKMGAVRVTEVTVSGNFIPDANTRFLRALLVGGGGGAGGADGQGAGTSATPGAGAGAGWSIDETDIIEASYTVVIGAGGNGGTGAAGGNGTTGGTSTITSTNINLTATGGEFGNGAVGSVSSYNRIGGDRGVGSGGLINGRGADGTNGVSANGELAQLGTSGASYFGGGQRGVVGLNGSPGSVPGEGGGSGNQANASNNRNGGDGADGIAVFWEFF